VVLSDWQMPRFEAPEALAMFRATGMDIPIANARIIHSLCRVTHPA
jgi:hypothetical protein